uniref:ATP synthase 8 n=1 Tax=Paramoeba pemaquidensis TaxID=180228 RepID=A0A1D8D973_9EUKA|nr:ATP synthase 8 [Paramoeba pemaquidensis]AOS85536.1 ATP synthase 8 [Paramoeba pemaquidensis]
MPQLDLGIYFFQIFINLLFFWFLYFYIKYFILGKLSNIIKIKNFLFFNNNYSYTDNSVFINQIELSYYKSNIWNNFHNFSSFFNVIKLKNKKIFRFLHLQNIYNFLNNFIIKVLNNKLFKLISKNLKTLILS